MLKRSFQDLTRKLAVRLQARRFRKGLFSGSPVVQALYPTMAGRLPATALQFRNGLILTLGPNGILDFDDPRFDGYLENSLFRIPGLVDHLNRTVVQSLVQYLIRSADQAEQRELAAEAISRLSRGRTCPVPFLAPLAEPERVPAPSLFAPPNRFRLTAS